MGDTETQRGTHKSGKSFDYNENVVHFISQRISLSLSLSLSLSIYLSYCRTFLFCHQYFPYQYSLATGYAKLKKTVGFFIPPTALLISWNAKDQKIWVVYIYIYIYIEREREILSYPRRIEFSGEEVIVLPLAFIASLFVYELRSRQPLNGCMQTIVIVIHNHLKFTSQLMAPRGWMVRSFGLAFESTRVSIPATGSYCLATLMSSDRTKQICLWMTIYTYICIFKYHIYQLVYHIVRKNITSHKYSNKQTCFWLHRKNQFRLIDWF